MSRRTGSADLPLHGGRVPRWLSSRMERLGRVLVEAIVLEFGRRELLRRLAHPFWFQSMGCVMGMDWHSSGITTSVVGALKRGLEPVAKELGVHVCGGRGRHSRKTPGELLRVGERTGLDGEGLGRHSRLVAKVDSAALQDGFQLYLHTFVVTDDGDWTVIQQGMDTDRRQARRYHWLSEGMSSFVEAPHAAIDGPRRGRIVNLTDRRARPSRDVSVSLADEPDRVVREIRRHRLLPPRAEGNLAREPEAQPTLPHLSLPARHELRRDDVRLRRLHGALAAAADRGPRDFPELLLTPGIGARTVESLALVAEVLYGAPHRFSDPGRFALAHGGKDGHPFPVPLKVYDRTLEVMRRAVEGARLGNRDRIEALRRLDRESRRLEGAAGPGFARYVQAQRETSAARGGRIAGGHGPSGGGSRSGRERRGTRTPNSYQ